MKVLKLPEQKKTKVTMDGAKDVWKQVPISSADGSPTYSFRVFTVEPRGHTPHHAHPFEHCNYIISGHGVLVNDKDQEMAIGEGHFALVLPDEVHQYKNTSDTEPLVMICAVPKEYE